MKIAIIGTVGIPATYGGFETLVENIVQNSETEFTVYCSSKHYRNKLNNYKGAILEYVPLKANGFSSILYDIYSLIHAILKGHRNFLVLGVSGSIIFPLLRFIFPSICLITNIDGIEWKRSKWKTLSKWYLKFSERIAIYYSSIVVADNAAIADYVEKNFNTKCSIIAYGGDHALIEDKDIKRFANIEIKQPYAFALCRIEPENNVHLILDAFAKTGFNLAFIGNWNSSKYGLKLKNIYSKSNNIFIMDSIYNQEILYSYRASCEVYIHGHSAGGTNPSLVEMMHFSKPIVAFDCSFNRNTMDNNGYYFNDSKSLIEIIENKENLKDGLTLYEIAKKRYTWDIIKDQYLELFHSNKN